MVSKKRCQFFFPCDCAQPTDPNELPQLSPSVQCNQGALRFIGVCLLCGLVFCATHRLPEQHLCTNLPDCRQQAFDRNKAKLEDERTVAPKVVAA